MKKIRLAKSVTPRAKRVGRGGACRHCFKCTVPPLVISLLHICQGGNQTCQIDGFPGADESAFITIYRTRVLRNGEMQVKRSVFAGYAKLVESASREKEPVVLIFNRFKNKKLITAYTTRNTVNRLPRKELYFNPVVPERSKEE